MKKDTVIKQAYEHTKFGDFMFQVCVKATKLLCKFPALYYILACTWGIIMTIIGLIVTAILFIAKLFGANITFKKYGLIYGIKVGPDYWGGCELGLAFVRDQKSADSYIEPHEFGHTFQNCILGPLFPFVVAIPSAIRYWIQYFNDKKGKQNPPYDSVWFEDAATKCGDFAYKVIIIGQAFKDAKKEK